MGSPASKHLSAICDRLLVCDQAVWVLSTHTNEPPNGSPLDVLAVDAVVELGDHDLYLVRHGHEILLDFGADPRTTAAGSLEIRHPPGQLLLFAS